MFSVGEAVGIEERPSLIINSRVGRVIRESEPVQMDKVDSG